MVPVNVMLLMVNEELPTGWVRALMVFNPHNGRAVIMAFNTSYDEGSTPTAHDAFG